MFCALTTKNQVASGTSLDTLEGFNRGMDCTGGVESVPERQEDCAIGPSPVETTVRTAPGDLIDTLPDAGSRFAEPMRSPWLSGGTLIDEKYRVDRLLGAGATGQVYLAHDESLDRDVALKLVGGVTGSTDEWRGQFRNEARTMARVRHENVVALFAAGEHERWLYLVMEYVPGVDLHTWTVDRGPLSLEEAHAVLQQVCAGLQAIHDGGAVHRDVKPGNVLVGAKFRVALTDFGLARWIDTAHSSGEHGVVGTPAYIAPEMILGCPDPALLNRVDIYSLGVLTFELLTNRLPFEGSTPSRMILDHVATPPPPVTRYRDELPSSVDTAVMAAMDKDPARRPASPLEFLRLLERSLET